MRKILLIVPLLLCILTNSDAQSQAAAKHKTTHAAKAALVISFYSIGSGTNSDVYNAVITAIKQHNAKNHAKLKYEEIHWGKEGERDLCFPVQSTRNFKQFVRKIKTKYAAAEHVRIQENAPCRAEK